MGKKSGRKESLPAKEEGGVKIDTPVGDAMDIDSAPAATDARAVRAARRKQRREELASQGHSATSSLASTPNPETEPTAAKTEKKSKKKSDKKSTPKKSGDADVEAEAPVPTSESTAPEASAPVSEPLPFVIDVKPSKPAVADTESHSSSERGGSVAPSTANGGDGLNRAARRRLMQIERHRGLIKKDLGIPAESNERQDEVDSLLAVWTAKFDEKAEIRAAKKLAKKEEVQNRGKGKGKGKGKQGRNSNDNEKQMKKQKQKQALRARQEAGSGAN